MKIIVRLLGVAASVTLALFLLLLVLTSFGRMSVLYVALAAFAALAVVRRLEVRRIPWVWSVAIGLGAVLTALPHDVRFGAQFPPGVHVREFTWGLPAGPVPVDAKGVPEVWWSGSCMAQLNAPEKVVVIGY
jgi:hypothetical protein